MKSNKLESVSVKEEELLFRASCGDKRAWMEIIKLYSELVDHKVKMNLNKYSLLDEEDIRSACYEGLVRAVKHYRPDSKASFNTYASYWLDCMIKAEKANVSNCHVPQKKRKYFKVIRDITIRDVKITVDEIQKTTGLDRDEVVGLLNAMDYVNSLEDRRSSKDNIKYIDTLKAEEHVEEIAIYKDELSRLKGFLERMDERQSYILKSVYGVFGCEKKSQTEIGRELGISKQRVDQIKKDGIRKCLEFMRGQ
ncbi:MAG: sigma-70 family RNA polymerase sigma factor [Sphaerochaetaceae bacterium]|nr:sigma-70 family RNA polymerase sigma factor [Sphaerochaetaceae bacterium]